ncbi:glycosyltransferase family 4 protein [Candidatus Thiosymbion oneisti]|uniref:glycosyltransferase family 4 protein n=1 Tax=Candidatus Thiosymbion oneisti TaxID=589554 RepID=UPI000ABD75C6|nr:glycosyltransferase family 4 protein [Candidatus Thiosymbion oneisti]
MHILFVTDNFPPETNAPASRTYEHVREWVEAGEQVTVLTCAPNFPFGKVYQGYRNALLQTETMDGIKVYRVWTYMAANQGFFRRTLDFVSFMVTAVLGSFRIQSPDVVVATSPQFFAGLGGYIISKLKRCPFVFEVRDLWPESIEVVGLMRKGSLVRLLDGLARYLYRHCDRLVTVGEGYKAQIQAKYHVPESKLAVIPNGVLFEHFSRQGRRDQYREELGWGNRFVVVYVGTHGMGQKLETLLEAAQYIADQNILFTFVGHGAEKEKLISLKDQKDLQNCVFYPVQPKEQVPRFYEGADACIVALRKSELFKGNYPSKMFEALSMACPVILSGEGRSAEILMASGGGLVVPPETPEALAEQVLYLREHPAEAAAMGERGRHYVQTHHSRRVWAQRYLGLLRRVTSGVNPITGGTPRSRRAR